MKNPVFSGQASGPSRFRRLSPELKSLALGHTLLAGLFPVSAGYRQGSDWSIGFDVQRPAGELLVQYCVEGHGEFRAGETMHPVGPGDLVVLGARQEHSYRTNPEHPWKVWWVYFDGLEAELWAKTLLEAGQMPPEPGKHPLNNSPDPEARSTEGIFRPGAMVVHAGHDPVLESTFLDLSSAMETAWNLSGLFLAAAALRTLLARCHQHLHAPRLASRTRRDLEGLVDWMHQNLDVPVDLDVLARRYGTCRDQLIRDFRACFQHTPMDYFLRMRLQKAAELMVTRGLMVSQAASALGFHDPCYFSRIFSKKMGLSPREWLETQA